MLRTHFFPSAALSASGDEGFSQRPPVAETGVHP